MVQADSSMRRSSADAGFGAYEWLATAVLGLSSEGDILCANTAAQTLIGRTAKSLAGSAAAELFAARDAWNYAVGRLPPGGVSSCAELDLGPAGAVRVRACVTPVPAGALAAPDGRGIASLLELSPVDEVLERERESIESHVRAANSELLRNLGHEIKNPLGGIRGAAQLLDAELTRGEDRECTAVILEEAARLEGLVERLLLPYRAPKRSEPVNVHEVLEHVLRLAALEFSEGLTVERDYDISAPAISADRSRLTQVFLNIVRNAAQALVKERAEGRAKIVVRTRIARDAVLQGERTRRALQVDIVDNGPGIPAEMRERIFFPLVTGRADGTGLGLSIVKTFVEAGGGRVSVESLPGRTDFTVLLPFDAAKPDGAQRSGRPMTAEHSAR